MGSISQPKPMVPMVVFVSWILIITLASSSSCAAGEDGSLSAYEVLEEYDFPVGLLPKGATDYTINRDTGEFTAHLNQTCKFHLENSYEVEYKSTITGVISKGKLKNLNGVKVKVLILWLTVVEVDRVGDELQFSVGIASANYPIDNFEESPQCGCGFDCVTVLSSSL
ncbi:hypothetical protein FNV43_RR23560 [Rhamnella rubrinervis]|uniref:Uncharacterized protein n=1 Tax=Rhamnella rubrinervis TaxID=2594499 RepID=A0A8K0GTH4_9ROSA|nr:hypothetical protein FNV43_RR23560 [Rhamnella rubrinervis]